MAVDVEPGYFEALQARAICDSGKFRLCGRQLKAFSFRHAMQLEALQCSIWTGEGLDTFEDYLLAAVVCSSSEFMVELPMPKDVEQIAFDRDQAAAVWLEYIRVCYGSRPRLWRDPSGGGSHCKAPVEEYVITFILRHSHGYSRDWLETAPIGMVLWIFESLAEQILPRSRIIPARDAEAMAAENSPEAERARRTRERIAGVIFKKAKSTKTRLRLLEQLDAGTLPKNWRAKLRK